MERRHEVGRVDESEEKRMEKEITRKTVRDEEGKAEEGKTQGGRES